MNKTVEIRWHGRGGQGAKTAALLLADVAFKTGKYVQGFPEYGPERMGAPITAYNRISDEPITVHSNIYEPDYVVVVDESLLETIDVTKAATLRRILYFLPNIPDKSELKINKFRCIVPFSIYTEYQNHHKKCQHNQILYSQALILHQCIKICLFLLIVPVNNP